MTGSMLSSGRMWCLASLASIHLPSGLGYIFGGSQASLTRSRMLSAQRQANQAGRHRYGRMVMQSDSESDGEEDANYERVKSIWEKGESLDYLFENNRNWAKAALKEDPMVFQRIKDGQQPKFLYIGCSDSRVPAENMLGLSLGELFVHRNVANQCLYTDYSLLAVLAYAVDVLEVTDIIVCGHYGCGGVKAATENKDHGLVEHWLQSIRNVQRLHMTKLKNIKDPERRHQRMVELNVQEQCLNLFANPIVQKKQSLAGQPRIHGWVYDVGTGLLKDVKVDFKKEIKKYKDIYRLYEFPIEQAYGAMVSKKGTKALKVKEPELPTMVAVPALPVEEDEA